MTAPPSPCRFAHEAMSTQFEILIPSEKAEYGRQAAQAIFNEIDRYEVLMSRFNPCGDIGQINLLKPGEYAPVNYELFECLQLAHYLAVETGGAFDVTMGPLMNCWRSEKDIPIEPSDEEIEAARRRIGFDRIALFDSRELDDEQSGGVEDGDAPEDPIMYLVGVLPDPEGQVTEGVEIDLGGIGKGYALDRIVNLLDDWDIDTALLSGGGSTVLAIGSPAGADGWSVGVGGDWGHTIGRETVLLRNRALSGSGTELKGQHILDPRTGRPARGHLSAWAASASAAVSDALSTAFMLMSTEEVEAYCDRHREVSAMVLRGDPSDPSLVAFGKW